MVDEELLEFIEGEERRKYASVHGVESLINAFHGPPWKGEEAERVYKICNERGITWQEYYGFKEKKGMIY